MQNEVAVGMNRTGLDMAPFAKNEMVDYAVAEASHAPEQNGAYEAVHMAYIEEADRVGSVPVPATMKGMATTAMQKVVGKNPEVLIDKLGERLAFERTGVRLYEAMLLKCGAVDGKNNPLDAAAVARIRDDEERHFHLLKRSLEKLGADPTAMTPCADVVGVQSLGILQVLTDPRTTIAQCLNALLTVELADNASWELLIELARNSGQDEIADEMDVALSHEQQHLQMVHGWLRDAVMGEAS
jgi:bacterioferritin (cytochrome b1)